jgi:hypothetical protein
MLQLVQASGARHWCGLPQYLEKCGLPQYLEKCGLPHYTLTSAAVLFAMMQETVSQLVAMAAARLKGCDGFVAFVVVDDSLEVRRDVILRVHRQNESQDDAVSFLTGHVIHPISRGSGRLVTAPEDQR